MSGLPVNIEIDGLMKTATPGAFLSNVLDQRWRMIKHMGLKFSDKPGNPNILHPFALVPVIENEFQRFTRKDEGLAAEAGVITSDVKIVAVPAGKHRDAGVVQAGEYPKLIGEWAPAGQVVEKMPVEV